MRFALTDAVWILPLTTVVAVALCLALVPLAVRFGLVDHPGGRKVHEAVTPLTGGAALLMTLAAAALSLLPVDRFTSGLLAGCALMFVVGLVDDRWNIRPSLRFFMQVVACAIIMAWAGVRLEDFGGLLGPGVLELGVFSAPLTIFAALGVINAFNLIDGMDGAAASIFLVAAAGMALFAAIAGQWPMTWLLLLAFAAVFGFLLLNARLPWNPRARIFMGDSGSMFLGYFLAWCFIALGNDRDFIGGRAMMPMTAVWLIAVPLLDTATQIWRRKRAGLSPFGADQQHLHHAFLRAGFSVRQAWLGITAFAAGLAAVGVVLDLAAVPNYLSFWLFIAVAFAYYHYVARSWAQQKFLGRHFIFNEFDEPEL